VPRGNKASQTQEVINFGAELEFELSAFELRRAGRVLKLERIPLEVLLLLIEQRREGLEPWRLPRHRQQH